MSNYKVLNPGERAFVCNGQSIIFLLSSLASVFLSWHEFPIFYTQKIGQDLIKSEMLDLDDSPNSFDLVLSKESVRQQKFIYLGISVGLLLLMFISGYGVLLTASDHPYLSKENQ